MADEPRRSGRATKGQHTKNIEDDKPTPAKGKGGKKKAAKEEVEEEAEDKVRCICGEAIPIAGIGKEPPMVCCDSCDVWQHNVCMGYEDEDERLQNKNYYCEECRPQMHPETVAALKQGLKIWEDRIKEYINNKKRGNKKGRKSKGGRASAAHQSIEPGEAAESSAPPEPEPSPMAMQPPAPPTPAPNTSTPAAPEPKAIKAEQAAEPTPTPTPAPVRATPEETRTKRRQSTPKPAEEPEAKRRKSSVAVPEPTGDLPAERQRILTALQTTFTPLIKERVEKGAFKLPGESNAEGHSVNLSVAIEAAISSHISDTTERGAKLRSIVFNVKKNETLLLSILNRTLNPDDLVNMSTEEMATEEQQAERSAMKEETDKQAMLVHDDGPRIRKSHKGDEIIGVDGQDGHSSMPERIVTSSAPTVGAGLQSPSSATPTNGAASLERKPSENFDINAVWNQVKSPDVAQGPFPLKGLRTHSLPQPRPSPAQHQSRPSLGPGEDADIDRLLDDDEQEWIEGAFVADSDVLWAGSIYMKKSPDVLKSTVAAKFFNGADVNSTKSWRGLLSRRLEISGRLLASRADEYLIAHRKSQRKVVSILQLNPSEDTRPDLEKVGSYFLDAERWGVINTGKDLSVQDLYFVPIQGSKGKPKFFDELDNLEYDGSDETLKFFLVAIVIMSGPSSPPAGESTPVPPNISTPQLNSAPSLSTNGNGDSSHPTALPQMDGSSSSAPPNQQPQPLTINTDPAYQPPTLATEILGPYINEPVAKQMVTLPNVTHQHLENLRDAFEKDDRCRADIGYLMQFLKAREAQRAQAEGM